MAVGCGPNLAKIFLIIFNIIFWLSGAALLGVGIWLLVDKNISQTLDVFKAFEGSSELIKYAAYVLIAVGAFVLVVGFFGCCGAIKESRILLGIYIVLLVLIMGLEIAAGVLAIIYRDDIDKKFTEEADEAFLKYYNKSDTAEKKDRAKAFTQGLNFVQKEFECCGINGPGDYTVKLNTNIAITCCTLKSEAEDKSIETLTSSDANDYVSCQTGTGEFIYDSGCVDKLKQWINRHATILIGVGIGIACLELFGFIFAVCLCRNVGDDE